MGNLTAKNKKKVEGDLKKKNEKILSLLINSAYFFIECVFILKMRGTYRLVVIHNGRILSDSCFETLRGAKIAFSKLFGSKACRGDIKAQWSPFYDPDSNWLEEKIRGS